MEQTCSNCAHNGDPNCCLSSTVRWPQQLSPEESKACSVCLCIPAWHPAEVMIKECIVFSISMICWDMSNMQVNPR